MKEIMQEIKEQEAAPLVVKSPEDYINALARNRLDLNPQKLQRTLESDVIGSPAQLASTLDKVAGREVVLNYLSPSGKRIKISSDREYPQESKLGKVSGLLEAAARYKVLKTEESVPDQVKLAGWQLDRGIKDFQKEAERIASGRTIQGKKIEVAKKAVILSLALAACSRANVEMPIPATETFPVESTATQVSEATQIAPSPTQESEMAPIVSQRLISEQEVLDIIGSEDLTPAFDEKYSEFQQEMSLNFPSSTFERWGIEATTADGGTIISPFFEVQDNEGESQAIAIVILLESGGFRYVRLEPVEVQGPDGRMYLTLSQTINAETGEEMLPEPMFWRLYSLEEWNALSAQEREVAAVYFNGLGGIIPEAQPIEGVKIAAIRELITPEAPIEGEWRTEVEGSHGTLLRLVIDSQVREREEVNLHEIRFVDVNTLEDYYGSQEGFVEAFMQSYGAYGATREFTEEFATLLWQAFPEGRAVDLLEAAFLRAVFERGREVGLFSGWNFEGYVLAVEEAHRSGNSSGVSVPLTEGRIIDPTRPVTFAFIDPDISDERGGQRYIGSSTEEWVNYEYSFEGPIQGQIPGRDPMGQWKKTRWQIGFDNEGGVVFAWILDERYYTSIFNYANRLGPSYLGEVLTAAIGDMLLSIQRNEFLNTSGTGYSVMGLETCRGSDFIQDSLGGNLGHNEEGNPIMYPILFPVSPNF